jgi:hypothetical protein
VASAVEMAALRAAVALQAQLAEILQTKHKVLVD